MSFSIRRAALTSVSIALFAALAPIACSSKTVTTEPVIDGCANDSACPAGNYCDNGVCKPACSLTNACPMGQTCGTDGRCTTSSQGGAGGGAGSSSGGTGAVPVPVPEAGPDADGAINPDAACGTGSAQAMLEPVSMFVMFDRSGSMIQNMSTRWANAADALTQFFRDPEAADLAIAIRYFPHDSPSVGCTNAMTGGCNAMACSQPLIPLMADPTMPLPKLTADPAPMDTHEEALVASITASMPTMGGGNMGGGTPTSVALDGALQWAAAYQLAHPRPTQQTVVLFVTDGQPNGCDESFANIPAIASAALAASGVRTYVVGLTDDAQDLAFLQDLAVAGGTEQAFIVLDGATAAAGLRDALKAIQGSALSCSFPFPTNVDGGMSDPDKINVDYTPGTAADPDAGAPMKVPFDKVDSLAACTAANQWYYDDNMNPTTINLCPATCMAVTSDPGTPKLDILLGCATRDPF